MNAYSRSDLDHFGNEFIFFSLEGGKGGKHGKEAEKRYLEVNTEDTLFHKSNWVKLLLFIQALKEQVVIHSLSAS